MACLLKFDERALKEWHRLGDPIRERLKEKLTEVLDSPRTGSYPLRGMPDCYKVTVRSSGYRLAYKVYDESVVICYRVCDDSIVVFVVSLGKRERS